MAQPRYALDVKHGCEEHRIELWRCFLNNFNYKSPKIINKKTIQVMGTVQQRCISHQTCSQCWTWTRLLHDRFMGLQLMPRWLRFSLVAGTCLSQPVILMITMDDGRLIKGCESCLTGSGKMDCPKLVIHFIDTSCSIIFTNKKSTQFTEAWISFIDPVTAARCHGQAGMTHWEKPQTSQHDPMMMWCFCWPYFVIVVFFTVYIYTH